MAKQRARLSGECSMTNHYNPAAMVASVYWQELDRRSTLLAVVFHVESGNCNFLPFFLLFFLSTVCPP